MEDDQKTLWFTFLLEQDNHALHSTWITPNTVKTTDAPNFKTLSSDLLIDSADLQRHIAQEQSVAAKQSVCLHIRIMTDDVVLAMLPWQQMTIPIESNVSRVIEVSPAISGDQSGYFSFTLAAPLLAIPSAPHFSIAGDRHYRIVQEYLHSHLAIYSAIPRVYSAAQLKRELKFQQPDLLYIYATYQHDTLLLDHDPTGDASVSLDTLGEWLQQADIRPIVILSLVMQGNITHYPVTLVKNSRLLWIQHSLPYTFDFPS